MTHEELIAKAREHIKRFDNRKPFSATSNVFTEGRVVEAALVYLGSQKREDYIEVYMNRETGEFITATYHPGSQQSGTGSASSP